MAQIEIPEPWRKQVCAILASEATGTLIEWTNDAERGFEQSFYDAWPNQLYAAFEAYLSGSHPTGCTIKMKTPAGETYEFLFPFKGRRAYGKILLRNDRTRIVVFSAHTPEKPKLSCE
jgi:hypothetical protein